MASADQSDSSALIKLYDELITLVPDNLDYVAKRDQLKVVVAAAEAKRQEEQLKKSQGLVWRTQESVDDMTGKTIINTYVRSTNEIEFDFPYQGAQRATLWIRKHPRWGTNVILQIERGQFSCSIIDDCTINARFDDGQVQSLRVSDPDSHDSTTRFVRDAEAFVQAVSRSRVLLIEANFFSEGSRTFRFDVSGYGNR